ncbi:MAG: hypothetical protein OHK0023_27810 [Anaerolineae bacterium]
MATSNINKAAAMPNKTASKRLAGRRLVCFIRSTYPISVQGIPCAMQIGTLAINANAGTVNLAVFTPSPAHNSAMMPTKWAMAYRAVISLS